jgi:hypothetical protein
MNIPTIYNPYHLLLVETLNIIIKFGIIGKEGECFSQVDWLFLKTISDL